MYIGGKEKFVEHNCIEKFSTTFIAIAHTVEIYIHEFLVPYKWLQWGSGNLY